ncbi:MAG: efflux RND transporter periplasmic adaptor subunit [Pirellulales bacterium]
MLSYLRAFTVPLIALSLFLFGVLHIISAERPIPDSPPPAYPPRSPYGSTIAGSGIVEPQSENIAVGSALPGVVQEVVVPSDKAGVVVKQGDPLFRIDDRQLQAQLEAQLAMLSVPKAQLAKLESMPRPEEVVPAEHRVKAARANLARAVDDYQRKERLVTNNAVSVSELVASREGKEFATAELARAEAELKLLQAGAWEPDKQIARANIAQIEAEILKIRTEIERSIVRAPVDGVVLQVNVRPGEYVSTPPNRPAVVLGDMRQPRVRVDIDEADIPRFAAGAVARAVVRGRTDVTLPLTFVRTEPYVIPKQSLTGAGSERVDTRVLQVVYSVDTPDAGLYVGQQLDVFIDSTPAGSPTR